MELQPIMTCSMTIDHIGMATTGNYLTQTISYYASTDSTTYVNPFMVSANGYAETSTSTSEIITCNYYSSYDYHVVNETREERLERERRVVQRRTNRKNAELKAQKLLGE